MAAGTGRFGAIRRDAAAALLLALPLGGCGGSGGGAGADHAAETPASALEQAAIRAGVIADAGRISPIGLYRRRHEAGLDSLCILPGAGKDMRFGLDATFGEHIRCSGHGTARQSGDKLILNFARSACLVVARYDGDRVALPGSLDVDCESLCSERGSLEGVAFPRVSREAVVAGAARDSENAPLCSD